MLYMHDIWLNWFEGALKPYEVCEYHEWKKNDKVDLADQIPLFRVKKAFFDYIEDGLNTIPQDLLETIKGRGFYRKDHVRVEANIFVISDGERIIAVDTMGYSIPIKKSRLIPRQEELVWDMIYDRPPMKFEFEPVEVDNSDILNTPPNTVMYGLTRKEREMKFLLFEALQYNYADPAVAKLKYLYSEWKYDNLKTVEGMEALELLNYLIEEASKGWSPDHLNLLKVAVKGEKFLEDQLTQLLKGDKKVG